MTNNTDRTNNMLHRAFDMFPVKHQPRANAIDPFPMYSFERPAPMFWEAFIEELFDRGLNEDEVQELLQSKHMRWMFDQNEDTISKLAKSMVTDDLITAANLLMMEKND